MKTKVTKRTQLNIMDKLKEKIAAKLREYIGEEKSEDIRVAMQDKTIE